MPIVPEGTKRAAALPVISAKVSCRRLTVGSSPYWSSPTSAVAMARRISSEWSGHRVGAKVDGHGVTVPRPPCYNWVVSASSNPAALSPGEMEAVFGPVPDGAEPLLTDLAATALLCARAAAGVIVKGVEASSAGARAGGWGPGSLGGPLGGGLGGGLGGPLGGGLGGPLGGGLGGPLGGGLGGSVDTKSSATDMVSDVDRGAEAAVAAVLTERRPDDAVLGEEGTTRAGTTGVRWVVDPLDGTTNFLFGIPQFSVSVAAERDGSTVAGIVVDVTRGETWAAVQGWGARFNGDVCHVASGRSTLATALVATGFGYQAVRRAWQAEVVAKVIPAVRDIRRFGSAALDLCWTGGGRVDVYYEWGLNPWDLAAGALICAEAGGRVEALNGRLILAAPPELFEPMRELLASAGGLDAPPGTEPAFW